MPISYGSLLQPSNNAAIAVAVDVADERDVVCMVPWYLRRDGSCSWSDADAMLYG